MTALQALRGGPFSARELAEALKMPFLEALEAAEALKKSGLAVDLPDGRWDVTDAGRFEVNAQIEALKRERETAKRPPRVAPVPRRDWLWGDRWRRP